MSKLVIVLGEEPVVLQLRGDTVTCGRAPENTVVLERPNISRRHCQVEPLPAGGYCLVDLDSTNGTFLNGEPVTRMALEHHDRIVVGQVLVLFLPDEADVQDALETSGVVFPWRPVRQREDDTDLAVREDMVDESGDFDEGFPRAKTVAFRDVPTTQYPIGLNPYANRNQYLKELLPRLSRVGQNVASELDLGRLMSTILAELVRWTGCERALLLLYDEDTGLLQPVFGHLIEYEELSDVERRFLDRVVKHALDKKTMVMRTGVSLTRDPLERAAGIPDNVDTCMCLPLTVPVRLGGRERRRNGRLRRSLGAIYLDCSRPIANLEAETMRLLEAVAAQAVTALQNAQLHYQATTDPMTRLYNRMFMWQLLTSELAAAKEDGTVLALLLLDLDHLKRVNDTWGHSVGDEVIKRVARRIRHELRKEDYASRWGGEEFLVLLPGEPIQGVVTVAERIREGIQERPIGEQLLRITASLGVALYPQHGNNADELLRAADSALYAAKEAGRNRVKVFGEGGVF